MKKDDQDNEIEEFVPEDGEGNTLPEAKRLKEKLKAAEEKAKEYLDNWQRAQADFINLRKKDEDEMKDRRTQAEAAFIKELLPVIDSLEKAGPGNKETDAILSQVLSILKRLGVSVINPVGEQFDPKLHEAIETQDTDLEERDHMVANVMQ